MKWKPIWRIPFSVSKSYLNKFRPMKRKFTSISAEHRANLEKITNRLSIVAAFGGGHSFISFPSFLIYERMFVTSGYTWREKWSKPKMYEVVNYRKSENDQRRINEWMEEGKNNTRISLQLRLPSTWKTPGLLFMFLILNPYSSLSGYFTSIKSESLLQR